MFHRKKPLIAVLVLVAAAGAAALLLYGRRETPRTTQRVPPYWQRTGFLSKILQDLNTTPGGLESIRVPDGFTVEVAAGGDLVKYPMFITFDDRGRLFVCESAGRNISDEDMNRTPEMRISLLEDTNADGVFDRSRVFADRITMTMGAQWYRGALYVAAPPDILRLEDTDKDGVADKKDVVLTGWPLHSNGTTLHGPYLGPDGWMYLTYNLGRYNIKTKERTTLTGPGGRVFRFRPDGTGLESIIGGGYDNGIEIVFTPAGEMIGTMTYYTNPRMGERDALLHYVEGGVYPKSAAIVNQYKRTGDLMPAMTKFARVAPAGLHLYQSTAFGREYEQNLFSAHFNPHRILRHIVERDGATFRTKDEDFLVSSDPDFHPTDVTEDADGSLLVVETGAWYLHSCPVSRIAKPQLTGTIYRVRRKGAARADDPWGAKLKLENRGEADLASFLADPRPAVRAKAQELLVTRGDRSIDALVRRRQTHGSAETRAAAVFALGRINSPKTTAAVRAALSDANFVVRIAAARMVGLNRDAEASNRLREMVVNDHPAARRQAATALGQLNDRGAAPALLQAAKNSQDRFIEHSIIYSLIHLKDAEPLFAALKSTVPQVRKIAMIALDQMDSSPFRREHLAPNLSDGDASLRRAALWIASRHPDWVEDVLKVLRRRLQQSDLSEEEAAMFREPLLAACTTQPGQEGIAEVLARPESNRKRRLFWLDTIDQCSVRSFPPAWIDSVRGDLRGGDTVLQERALRLARSRQITSLDAELKQIAASESAPVDLRVLAVSVLVSRDPALPQSSHDFLLGLLRPGVHADVRQSAAQVLGRAKWTDSQLLTLSKDYVPSADPLALPYLLDAYQSARSASVGKAMVVGLLQSKYSAEGIAAERIPALLKNFPSEVQSLAKPLLVRIAEARESRAARLKDLQPLLRGGDIHRGREIFFGQKAACSSCHTILTEGGEVGPDLTGVGAVRSGFDLLEAVVYPSASFVPGHEVYRVETDREIYTGVQGENTPDSVLIISGPRERVRIPRKEIRSMRPASVSLMPDGFADDLSREELADLLAFLQAQTSRDAARAQL